jgi:hypothetical protein
MRKEREDGRTIRDEKVRQVEEKEGKGGRAG